MSKQIIKRDGRIEAFKRWKIENAVIKAMQEVNEVDTECANKIAKYVECFINENEPIYIEDVQDMVELELIKAFKINIAKAYISYRQQRKEYRECNNGIIKGMEQLFTGNSEEIRNNANKDGKKLQSLRAMIADIACNVYADTKSDIIPKYLLKEHGKGFYIHDKNYFCLPMFNCMLINWPDMLDNGFYIGTTKIESPNSLTVAIALLSQIVAHVSSNCYGGVTLPKLTHLSKYAKRSLDKHREIGELWCKEGQSEDYAWSMLEKEILNAAQGFEYEIQTLQNARAETPFLTIELDYGLDTPVSKEEKRLQKLIINSFLKTRIKGLTDGVTPTFPKIIFELKDGVNLNKEDPDYDLFKLSVECTSKRMYPDYTMADRMIEETGCRKPSMGCRSFLSSYFDIYGNHKTLGRFNQGVCSVNLVRAALLALHDEKKFYSILTEYLDLCRDALFVRHKKLRTVKAGDAPILYMSGAVSRLNAEDSIIPLLENNYSTLSIGYVGIQNALVALYGCGLETEKGREKAEDIMSFMKKYCDDLKEATGLGFSLYGTPAEVLATKFCKKDIDDFGLIEGVTSNGYYENSFHFPSDTEVDPFEKIDIESRYSKISTGGSIQYVEFGSLVNNPEAIETIIRHAYTKCKYFGINSKPDRCYECGYVGEILNINETENDYECPNCGNTNKLKMSVIRRLCGYLGSLSERPTVDNKMKEIHHRVTHIKK